MSALYLRCTCQFTACSASSDHDNALKLDINLFGVHLKRFWTGATISHMCCGSVLTCIWNQSIPYHQSVCSSMPDASSASGPLIWSFQYGHEQHISSMTCLQGAAQRLSLGFCLDMTLFEVSSVCGSIFKCLRHTLMPALLLHAWTAAFLPRAH